MFRPAAGHAHHAHHAHHAGHDPEAQGARRAPHVAYAMFADAANVADGKLNVLAAFDAIGVTALPATRPRVTVVLRIPVGRADVGRHALRFSWRNPLGAELLASVHEMHFTPPAREPTARELAAWELSYVAQFDLPLDLPGEYVMRVAMDDGPPATLSLHVFTTARGFLPPSTASRN